MATDKQIAANRRNARKSTGPKTHTGRANSSRNAFRHGLTKPLTEDPRTLAEAHRLAEVIFGMATDSETRELHMHFALAHLEIRRIRTARNRALNELLERFDDRNELAAIRYLVGYERYERMAMRRLKSAIRKLGTMLEDCILPTEIDA